MGDVLPDLPDLPVFPNHTPSLEEQDKLWATAGTRWWRVCVGHNKNPLAMMYGFQPGDGMPYVTAFMVSGERTALQVLTETWRILNVDLDDESLSDAEFEVVHDYRNRLHLRSLSIGDMVTLTPMEHPQNIDFGRATSWLVMGNGWKEHR